VTHRRLRPRPHRLRYRVFWMLLDHDEIGRLPQRLRLFSHNRFNALSLFDADRGDGSGRPLRDRVEDHLRAAGLATDGGAIRLFCMPRVFGFGFNPLSVNFCYQGDGSLAAILDEVHNTFRERHSSRRARRGGDGDDGRTGCGDRSAPPQRFHCRKGFTAAMVSMSRRLWTWR
jgi:DUF1365 family protein